MFVDDRPCSTLRPCSLNYALLRRTDVLPILLRTKGELFGAEYLAATAGYLQFWVDTTHDVAAEAGRFRRWCLGQDLDPAHFCCVTEPRQEFWQAFARACGLPGLPPDVARALRNKPAMKDRIRASGFRTAEYAVAANLPAVLAFAKRHGYPVVLKPVDGWGALATHLVLNQEEANKLGHLFGRFEMMVETYVPYREFECCALIANGRVLDIYPSILPTAPIDVAKGGLNANISMGRCRNRIPVPNLHGTVQRLVDGFRLPHGYLHMELFVSEDGTHSMISELALRYPGCEIAKNHAYAYGFDIASATIDLYLGRVPELNYKKLRSAGDLLLPYSPGRVTHVTTPGELRRLPGVREAHVGVRPGDILPEVDEASFNCSGWVIVEGHDPDEVEDRMRTVLSTYELFTT